MSEWVTSDRIALLKTISGPSDMNIIQVYAPKAESTETEKENFYQTLEHSLKHTQKHELNIIIGDFKAKIGPLRPRGSYGCEKIRSGHEKWKRRKADPVLPKDGHDSHVYIFLTTSQKALYMESSVDNPERIMRNQIDFINLNKGF